MNRASSSFLPSGLPTTSAGLLVSVSPLCVWTCWQTFPSVSVLAPLFLTGLIAGAAVPGGHRVRCALKPLFPALRFTLFTALLFTAVCVISEALFLHLPLILAAKGLMPATWLVTLGHASLLIRFCALVLLTLAAASISFLQIRKCLPHPVKAPIETGE